MPRHIFKRKIEHKHLVAAIYTCVLFLDRLNLTIVNIALPTIADHLWTGLGLFWLL